MSKAATRASIMAAALVGAGLVTMRKPGSVGKSEDAAGIVDRAHRMHIGLLATATGRSVRDVKLSIMLGDVVGRPVEIARKLPGSFRADLHKGTALDTVPPHPRS